MFDFFISAAAAAAAAAAEEEEEDGRGKEDAGSCRRIYYRG